MAAKLRLPQEGALWSIQAARTADLECPGAKDKSKTGTFLRQSFPPLEGPVVQGHYPAGPILMGQQQED